MNSKCSCSSFQIHIRVWRISARASAPTSSPATRPATASSR